MELARATVPLDLRRSSDGPRRLYCDRWSVLARQVVDRPFLGFRTALEGLRDASRSAPGHTHATTGPLRRPTCRVTGPSQQDRFATHPTISMAPLSRRRRG